MFIAIEKDAYLLDLHKEIWDLAFPFGKGVSDHYTPKNWIPHVTLASRDINPDSLVKMLKFLGHRDTDWTIEISRFSLGRQPPDDVSELIETYNLTGKKSELD